MTKPFDIDRPLPFLQKSEWPAFVERAPINAAAAKTTTVLDYMRAAKADSESGKMIDAGLTPYLLNMHALEVGTWPYLEVEDVGVRANEDDSIGIWVGAGKLNLPPDTLLFWR